MTFLKYFVFSFLIFLPFSIAESLNEDEDNYRPEPVNFGLIEVEKG